MQEDTGAMRPMYGTEVLVQKQREPIKDEMTASEDVYGVLSWLTTRERIDSRAIFRIGEEHGVKTINRMGSTPIPATRTKHNWKHILTERNHEHYGRT